MRAFLFGGLVMTGLATAWAEDPPKADAPAKETPAAEKAERPLPGQQDLDDRPLPLVPVKPRSLADDNRLKAGSWLATGRILESKNDVQGALEAYKKALGFDPQATEVYRAMVGAAVKLGMNEEALEWAEKVSELDPEEYMLRINLGGVKQAKGDVAGAVRLWEEALRSPRMKKESPSLYVAVHHELSKVYRELGRNGDAVKSLEIVFNALAESGDVALDFETRTKLLEKDAAGTFEAFGEQFLEAERYDLAVKAFEKAAERKKGGSASLNYNMARLYLKTDKADKALEELQKYFDAQRQAKGALAYALLGDVLKKLGKEQELLPRLEALAEKDSRNSDLQYYLADQYRQGGRLADAEKAYRKTLLFAASAQGYQGLAAVYRQMGKPSEVLEMLGKAYAEANDIDPLKTELKAVVSDEKLLNGIQEAAQAARKDNKLDFPTGVVTGYLLSEAKRNAPAEEFFRYALSLRKTKEAYFGLVDALFDQRKYADAVKVLEEAERDGDEERVNYLFTMVRAKTFAGDTEGALGDLNRLKRLSPVLADNPQIAFQEAWVYYYAHKFDEAIPRFEKIIAKSNTAQARSIVRQAQFSLSNCYVLQGDYRKGEQILEEVYKESPDDPSVNNDLGYLYADQGKNLEQAEKMIRKALAAEPENGAYLDSMGWVLFKLGKAQDALPFLEKAIAKSSGTGDETLYDHLGDCYDKVQQPAKALEAWKTALKHAKEASRPDAKLIQKIEDKIKSRESDPGKLKPAKEGSP